MILGMMCVWPFCLIRRDREYHSGDSRAYGISYQLVNGMHAEQRFFAQEAVLKALSFCFDGDANNAPEDFSLTVKLVRIQNGDVLFERELTKEDLLQSMYITIEEMVRLKTRDEYALTFDVFGSGDTGLVLTTTPGEENYFHGASGLFFNGEVFPEQLYMKLLYYENMNLKNTLFQWSFLWVIGGTLILLIQNMTIEADKKH